MLTVGGTSNDARRLWYRASGSEPSYCWEDPPGHTGDVNDRVKPEIVAPAQNISTYFYNGSGVSASTPMVAGDRRGRCSTSARRCSTSPNR